MNELILQTTVIGSSMETLVSFWNGNRALKITTAIIICVCEGIVVDAPCEVTTNMLRIHHLLVRIAIAREGEENRSRGIVSVALFPFILSQT